MDETKKTLDKVEKYLFGNGSAEIGHDERFRRVEDWVESQKHAAAERKSLIQKIVLIIVPTLIIGFFAFLGQAVYFWFNTVPKIEQILNYYQNSQP